MWEELTKNNKLLITACHFPIKSLQIGPLIGEKYFYDVRWDLRWDEHCGMRVYEVES